MAPILMLLRLGAYLRIVMLFIAKIRSMLVQQLTLQTYAAIITFIKFVLLNIIH